MQRSRSHLFSMQLMPTHAAEALGAGKRLPSLHAVKQILLPLPMPQAVTLRQKPVPPPPPPPPLEMVSSLGNNTQSI